MSPGADRAGPLCGVRGVTRVAAEFLACRPVGCAVHDGARVYELDGSCSRWITFLEPHHGEVTIECSSSSSQTRNADRQAHLEQPDRDLTDATQQRTAQPKYQVDASVHQRRPFVEESDPIRARKKSVARSRRLRHQEIHFDRASGEHHCVESAGRDWLPLTRVQLALDRSLGLHREVGATLQHSQQAPRAVGESMVPSQTSGQRRLVKRSCGSNDHEANRKFRPVTEWAVKIRADMGGASCRTFHPRPRHQRRTMSHVLTMVASKLCDPITDVVSPEPDDRALHAHSQPGRGAEQRIALGRACSRGHDRSGTSIAGSSAGITVMPTPERTCARRWRREYVRMTDPRNIAYDKKVASDKAAHSEDIAPGADETPQPGRKPHMEHHAADDTGAGTDPIGADDGA